jgi:hypothetical protein
MNFDLNMRCKFLKGNRYKTLGTQSAKDYFRNVIKN